MAKVQLINGYTESVWKSLVVKSVRLGWLEGLEMAIKSIGANNVNTLLIAQLFEDIFPLGYKELDECAKMIYDGKYSDLLKIQTHHGKGYTQRFCDYEDEAVSYGRFHVEEALKEIRAKTRLYYIAPRVNNCIYTWHRIVVEGVSPKRELWKQPFIGIPECCFDCHTYEGKSENNLVTTLSGQYYNHLKWSKIVQKEGWDGVRKIIIKEPFREVHIKEQLALF